MKPYQLIDTEVENLRQGIQNLADVFNERTGGVVIKIGVDFIDVSVLGEIKQTIVRNVDIETSH